MQKINWEQKLSSRKFWAAVCGFIAPLFTLLRVPSGTAAQITALIMAGASLIAYILSEGFVDAATAQNKNNGNSGQ